DEAADAELRLLVTPEGSETGARAEVAAVISEATTVAAAVALARDLTNTPSLRKSPQWLADAAVQVAAESGLVARIWTDQELLSSGFGGLTAVGSGSDRPPRLIELSYTPSAPGGSSAQHGADGSRRHIVLVGKGITFDSGGLSLKPNDGMKAMKTDMAGGAAVIAGKSGLGQPPAPGRGTRPGGGGGKQSSGPGVRPRGRPHPLRRPHPPGVHT